MGRWEPGIRTRLSEAALTLFSEVGFEQTTVADIAARAGVTKRTFFRQFSDKREALFGGWPLIENTALEALAAAPRAASPQEAVTMSLNAVAATLEEASDRARARHAIVTATPELHERDLAKFDLLARRLATALQVRGVEPTRAAVAAQTGVAAYRIAFQVWADDPEQAPLQQVIDRIARLSESRD